MCFNKSITITVLIYMLTF